MNRADERSTKSPRMSLGFGVCMLLAGLWLGRSSSAQVPAKHPVFVGVKVCMECHDGRQIAGQCSTWMLSKHAQAYAVLSKPESLEIAKRSGIVEPPTESPVCLGCHATGADAEPWERDPTFSVLDGVQCEKCHGPGSEYIDPEIMMDRERAVAAGLVLGSREYCHNCHAPKGSHEAVLKRPPLDMDKAWKEIAHPTPADYEYTGRRDTSAPTASNRPEYVGSTACGECHRGRDFGFQFSRWRLSPHAKAYAVLATEKAKKIARDSGVAGDPQRSEACLRCHTTAFNEPAGGLRESYTLLEGVGCEACHGPGSTHADDMALDAPVAADALRPVQRDTCLRCHENAHGKPFNLDDAWPAVSHPTHIPAPEKYVEPPYKTPMHMAFAPNSSLLFVTCEAANAVAVVDTRSQRKIGEIAVGRKPQEIAFTPDGTLAFVTNRLDDSVSVIDVRSQRVVETLAVGDEPHGVVVDTRGRFAYVLNTLNNDISVIDVATLTEVKRLAAGNRPWSAAITRDGSRIAVSNVLSDLVGFRQPARSEITIIDADEAIVVDRPIADAANGLRGIDWHPSGRFAFVTMARHKNLVPMTRLLQGWTITNGLAIVWADGHVDQVLLDDPGLAFPDVIDVAFTPNGRWALATSASSNRVAVIDVDKLIALLESASDRERREVLPNHLGTAYEIVTAHLNTGTCPRGIVVAPDGKLAYTANSLDDTLSVIDVERKEVVGTIDLGGPKEISKARWGERLFHSADIAFRRQFSCSTCHPDGHVDGLTYDIEPDGLGVNPVDNRTLRGILDTAPFKWEGINPSLSRQCGPRLAVFFTRLAPFTPEELDALDYYISTIPRPPNRHRPFGAPLTEAQRRGKLLFERTHTNDGRLIPPEKRCVTCHFPPLYTDRRIHNVGTQMPLDKAGDFDVPQLTNVYNTAPYLHNGAAKTLEEIWTLYNPYDQHGVTNDMTKDQLNDLIEYLKTL